MVKRKFLLVRRNIGKKSMGKIGLHAFMGKQLEHRICFRKLFLSYIHNPRDVAKENLSRLFGQSS